MVSVSLSVYLFVCPSICLSFLPSIQSASMNVCQFICLLLKPSSVPLALLPPPPLSISHLSQGDLACELLGLQAQMRLDSLCDQLRHRTVLAWLKEYSDYCILQTWLLEVRGGPLLLATPPPATLTKT